MKQSREAAEALSHGAFLCGASLRATFLRRLSFRARAAGANLAAVSAHGLESNALSAAANKCTSARQATQLAYQIAGPQLHHQHPRVPEGDDPDL